MSTESRVNYSCPSGFLEFLPGEHRLERRVLAHVCGVFERYGYAPIETPAVERLEVLQAKGGQGDNIIYGIAPILPPSAATAQEDRGDERRALKFDQTVPLAAYIARHRNDLTFPFARYQVDPVWRGERPKAGRYRQFRQCDIDVVGRGELSLLYDAQVVAIIWEVFEGLGIGDFRIAIGNRRLMAGLLAAHGVEGVAAARFCRAVDSLDRRKAGEVRAEVEAAGGPIELLDRLIGARADADEVLDQAGTWPGAEPGVDELRQVVAAIRSLDVPAERWTLDLKIARGLDYYTGTVYETHLLGHEGIGSICSGGRYDELVGTFTGESMPGVGISIGLTRLLRKLLDLGLMAAESESPADAIVINLADDLMPEYLALSQELRREGLNVETSFAKPDIGRQLKSADRKGIPVAVILGPEEASARMCRVKALERREEEVVPRADVVAAVRRALG